MPTVCLTTKAETRDIGGNDYHGDAGPVSVATPKANNNVYSTPWLEAGVQAGYPRTDDLNGYQQEGFGPMDRTVTPQRSTLKHRTWLFGYGQRSSESNHYHPCHDQSNFVQWQTSDWCWIFKVLIKTTWRVYANKEVLLCAGHCITANFATFGVGSSTLPVSRHSSRAWLTGCRWNLQDHLEMYFTI